MHMPPEKHMPTQRGGSAAQSGQSLLDAASARHSEIESPRHCGIWRAPVDGSHSGRVLPVLVVRTLYPLFAAYEISVVMSEPDS